MSNDPNQLQRTVLWRRIDLEGMDACSYYRSDDGYTISGTALYLDGSKPAKFAYRVSCDPDWSSRSVWGGGWFGTTERNFSVSRERTGIWTMDGEEISEVTGLLDIDLGFTPATNTNAIRRLDLEVGEEVVTTAVWLDTEDWRLKPLRQVYRRLSATEFAYSSPSHNYTANLVTDDFGIIHLYPHLWTVAGVCPLSIN